MSTLGATGKVGLAVLVAVVLIFYGYLFFNGGGLFRHTYNLDVLFDNADGITPDVSVELAGVEIGRVKRVLLTANRKADLTLEIKDKVNGQSVQIPTGSQFTINSALLGGQSVVMVIPPPDAGRRPGDNIAPGATDLAGTRTGDITASLSHANALLDQLTVTTRRVDALIADPRLQGHMQHVVANLDAASANGVALTRKLNGTIDADNSQLVGTLQRTTAHVERLLDADNAQLQAVLRQTQAGSRVALSNLTDTTAQVKGITRENRAKLSQIVSNLNDTTAAVAGITEQTNDLLKNGGISQNLSATVANLKATTDKLNTITGSLQNLTTDPAVQSNLKQTVENIKDSTEESKFLLQRLNKLAGTKRPAAVVVGPGGAVVVPPVAPGGGTASLPRATATVPLILPRVDLVQNTRTNHFRADVDAVAPVGRSGLSFARAGLYGLGDSNRVNLQYGTFAAPGSLLDYRYGLYSSKLALGGDLGLGKRGTLSFDYYDPNIPHLNAHGVLMLAPELGLLVGGEDVTRRSGFVFGLEYRSSK